MKWRVDLREDGCLDIAIASLDEECFYDGLDGLQWRSPRTICRLCPSGYRDPSLSSLFRRKPWWGRKASLLAGDINHLKELRKKAAEGSEGLFMPLDVDEDLSIRVQFAWCPLFNQGFYMLWLLAWNAVWFKTSFWSFPSDHKEPRNWTLEGTVGAVLHQQNLVWVMKGLGHYSSVWGNQVRWIWCWDAICVWA